MLPAQHRITRGEDYRRVLGRGSKSRTPLGLVSVLDNALGSPRFGFVVSKAVGNAVLRNLVKRRLRAAAQRLLGEPYSVDVVVRAAPGATKVTVAEAEHELRKVLSR
ncbi:Ribonuclease P protein component [Pontimonas salivibrio]|uniref:Ribonuclease P protein component n=1 Tax=Pontimonas salivibrio TaxID=1159327 RepID=A0A2L2BNA1_9MICO|nr:ribonuclease P protein component [Pontimonas salivibrio]AVG23141.1 Ribonuclease P protein component [Pontimonas salivibrio]